MKRSAGVIPYKIVDNKTYVYLERPGGPFWQGKDKWSICKGEYTTEKPIDAAIREFKEESSFIVTKEELKLLGSFKMKSSNKLITIFMIEKDFDPSKMKSNTFKKEFPANSGIIREFPEMDKAEWFEINEAHNKIFNCQKKILEKLQNTIDF